MSVFRYYYQSTPPSAATYGDAVLALSPTAYWRFGESSGDALDSSGNGYTLTANGSPGYGTAGWASDGTTAITFNDANNDCFERSDAAWMDVGTNDFSVVWCMKHASGWPTLAEAIIGHDGAGNPGQFYIRLRENNPDTIRLNMMDAVTGEVYPDFVAAADVLDSGSWVHCAMTMDRDGNATLYVNGAAAASASIASSSAYDLTNARPMRVGAANTSGLDGYNGSLGEVAFWNGTLLSSSDIATLYAAR